MKYTRALQKGLKARQGQAASEARRLEIVHTEIARQLALARSKQAAYAQLILRFNAPPNGADSRAARKRVLANQAQLSAELLKILQEDPAAPRGAVELALVLVARLGLGFADTAAMGRWIRQRVCKCLQAMTDAGQLIHTPELIPGTGLGSWQLMIAGCHGVNR
ncbi:MAG TPA: hypothetical protein VIY90_14605 [Steroidobacteraceae bacterium]